MSPLDKPLTPAQASFPRVSGDEPVSRPTIHASVSFSPRERG